MTNSKRVFIGGVGYNFLSDFSIGPLVIEELKELQHTTPADWPDWIEIDDISPGGPIAAVHRFGEIAPYERVILVGAVKRERTPGQIYAYRWDGQLPSNEEIQERVAEAVTGVINVDNHVIIGGYFKIWPETVIVIEIEPYFEQWDQELSPVVSRAIPLLIEKIRQLAFEAVDNLATSYNAVLAL